MSTPGPTLRSRVSARLPFDAASLLTGPLRRFYLGTLISAFGTGLILSLFVIYFTQVRHFPVFVSTLLLSWESILGLCAAPLYGTLVDRLGPSRVLAVVMPVVSLGIAGIGFASTEPLAFGVATLLAVGGAGMWGSMTVLMTRFVREDLRQDAFGVNFMLLNVGIGLGGLVGTSVASVHDLHSFQALYVASAILGLANAAVVFSLRRFGGRPDIAEHEAHLKAEGWAVVLRDRRLIRYLGASMLMVICGYGSVEAGLPYFVTEVRHLPLHVVGLLFFFNTSTIVVAQIFVLGRIKGKSRSLVIAAVGLMWGTSWLLATSSLYEGAIVAVMVLCVGQIVFALGETMWSPVAPALVNDLAPEHLRGRYNALSGLIWGVSGTVGPIISGLYLEGGHGVAWTVTIAAGAIIGGLGATTLRRVLTAREDGREPVGA